MLAKWPFTWYTSKDVYRNRENRGWDRENIIMR